MPVLNDSRPVTAGQVEPRDDEQLDVRAVLAEIQSDLRDLMAWVRGCRKEHFTVDEISHAVGRSAYTVRRWISEGRIQATRVSGTGPKGRLLVHREPSQYIRSLINAGIVDALQAVVELFQAKGEIGTADKWRRELESAMQVCSQ